MRSVVLLSGGIDSTVLLADLIAKGDECLAVTFNYGQLHDREVDAADEIADYYCVARRIVPFPLRGSALTGQGRIPDGHAEDVDATYVPGRNIVMIAIAASFAEQFCASAVLFGANKDDAAGYPDCRPAFITAIDNAVSLGTARGISVAAPYASITKAAIVARGRELGVPFDRTWSCYRGDRRPCGRCGACEARDKAMTVL